MCTWLFMKSIFTAIYFYADHQLNSIPGLTDGVTLEPEPETPTTSMEVITEQPLPQAQPGGSTEVTFSAASSETELGQKSDPTDETLNEVTCWFGLPRLRTDC